MSTQAPPPEFSRLAKEIWLRPRATIRTVVDYHPRYKQREIILYFSLAGGLESWRSGADISQYLGFSPLLAIGGLVLTSTLLDFIVLLISLYGTAWLLKITNRMMDGKASFDELATALTWAMVPALFGVIFSVAASLLGDLLGWLPTVIELVLLMYSLNLMVFTVAEVQQYSVRQSIIHQLIILAILLLPLLLFIPQILEGIRSLGSASQLGL